jgi:hypothetical protein
VIITGRTYDSITLSFDHFAPEEYHHGYVAMVSPLMTSQPFFLYISPTDPETKYSGPFYFYFIIPNIFILSFVS